MHIMLLIALYMLSMISAHPVNCCIMHGLCCIIWLDVCIQTLAPHFKKTKKTRRFIYEI